LQIEPTRISSFSHMLANFFGFLVTNPSIFVHSKPDFEISLCTRSQSRKKKNGVMKVTWLKDASHPKLNVVATNCLIKYLNI